MKRLPFIICSALIVTLSSCASTVAVKKSASTSQQILYTYKEPGLKLEAERLFLTGCTVSSDESASKGQYVSLSKESNKIETRIQLKEGKYELLVKMKARDTDHSFLTVSIDDKSYSVYPSNPPLGVWELTTRTPLYIQISEPKIVSLCIQADSKKHSASKNLCIDYIQIVRVEK